ncbi:MAG: hypothetical protein ACREKS_04015 [Candidatus Rokuibacteriota bacterium]
MSELQWRGWSIAGSFRPGRAQAWSLLKDGRAASALFCFQFGILYVLVALPCVANVMAAPPLAAAATYGLGGVVMRPILRVASMVLIVMGLALLYLDLDLGLFRRLLPDQSLEINNVPAGRVVAKDTWKPERAHPQRRPQREPRPGGCRPRLPGSISVGERCCPAS